MIFHATGTITGPPDILRPLMAGEDAALADLKARGVVISAFLTTNHTNVFLILETPDEPSASAALDRLPLVTAGHLQFTLQPVTTI